MKRQLGRWGRKPDEVDRWIRNKWYAIRGRCEDPLNSHYEDYGKRGIRLSDEFKDPLTFIDYMRSVGDANDAYARRLEIDRIDNDRGYERGNLRWSTRFENVHNRRCSIYIVYHNERILFHDFVSRHTTLTYNYAYRLYHEGRTLDEIVRIKGRGPRGPYRKRPRL